MQKKETISRPSFLRTGEILLGEGLISQEDLLGVLAIQDQGRARPLSNSNRLFGMILCDLNLITFLDNFLVLHKYHKLITLDQVLVNESRISSKAIALARKKSEQSRTPFFSLLLNEKIISLSELQKQTYNLYRIPFRRIRQFEFNPFHTKALAALINEEIVLKHGIIPLVKQEKVILVGITDPSALLVLGTLRDQFPLTRFKAVFIPFSEFKTLFNRLYRKAPLFEPPPPPTAALPETKQAGRPIIITVTSGKGGAGKTSISLNLALELALSNQRVCLFDADLGLANINILTGIQPENDLESVLLGTHTLDEIVIKNFQGIDIIPGSSGVERMADLTKDEATLLIDSFLNLDRYDYFIFDTSAGVSNQVLSFCMASQELLMVVTPEPTCLTDAYALLKLLATRQYTNPVNVIVNQVKNVKTAKNAYGQLRDTVNRFLAIKLFPLGIVVADRHVSMSVIAQSPFITLFPDAPASKCIHQIAKKLMARDRDTKAGSLEFFWRQCLNFLTEHPSISKNKDTQVLGLFPKGNKPDLVELLQGLETRMSALVEEIKTIKDRLRERS